MNLVFLEEALLSGTGHWPLYIADITAAFREAGDNVAVLAHKQANHRLLKDLNATAWFSCSCWTDQECQGSIGGLRHAVSFVREVEAWLCQAPQTDWVCALTMRLQHLLAFTLLARRPWHWGRRRYLLLFVQGFSDYQGAGLPVTFPATRSTWLARWCFRLLAPAVRTGRVVLAAETLAMQTEMELFTMLPVRLFPHPVSLHTAFSISTLNAPESGNRPLTITSPGFARYEKGSDLFQEACKSLMNSEPCCDLRVLSQWPDPFLLPDGSLAFPDQALLASGRYQLINTALDRHEYAALLYRSDLIVLPYRRSSYHNRVSRVAIEAAIQGIPLVYMSGTWCEELVELTGAGVAIPEESAEAVCQALRTAFDHLPNLRLQARRTARLVAEKFSGRRFRQRLLEC